MTEEITRLNYFTHQFLQEKDFKDEQKYHIDMRRGNNKALYSWGIVEGLTVTKIGEKQVSVSSGIAIDKLGREIVLLSPLEKPIDIDRGQLKNNPVIYLTIEYEEVYKEDYKVLLQSQTENISNYRRVIENPKIETSVNEPATDGSVILLAKITLDDNGNFSKDDIDLSGRKNAGAKRLEPDMQKILVAAGLFLHNRVTKRITFEQDSTNGETKTVSLNFRPELIVFGGTSRLTLENDESYSGLIYGFVNNKVKGKREQQCFCSGGTKNQQGYWIQNTETGSYLCRVSYKDETTKKGETLTVDIGDIIEISAPDNNYDIKLKFYDIELKFYREKISHSWNSIDNFVIDIWMLCLG